MFIALNQRGVMPSALLKSQSETTRPREQLD